MPYLRPEFVGCVVGVLNVAYGYACGTDSLPPAQDTNLTPPAGLGAWEGCYASVVVPAGATI